MKRCPLALVAFFVLLANVALATQKPIVCPPYLAALADAHEDAIAFDGDNRRGGVAVIDPWAEAERVARDANLPFVVAADPKSAAAFQTAFEDLVKRLTPTNAEAELAAFSDQWEVPRGTLLRILLPYRLYGGRSNPGLRALFPDDAAVQRAAAQLKLEAYLDENPRLRERQQYYVANVTRLTVPEMVAELRAAGDAHIDERKARKEIGAFHVELSASLERPLAAAETKALEAELGATAANALRTVAEAAHALRGRGVTEARIAQLLGMTEARVSFFFHAERTQARNVPWEREVLVGTRVLREDVYAQELYAQELTAVTIADRLNEARGAQLRRPILAGDPEFRTVEALRARLNEMGLTKGAAPNALPLVVPGFGTVRADGQLRVPEALDYVRHLRAQGNRTKDIADALGVSETTVRTLERKWEEQVGTGLPTPLRRFLEGAEPGARHGLPQNRRVRPDGTPRFLTKATLKDYQPLRRALLQKFRAGNDFTRMVDALESDLPTARRQEFRDALKKISRAGDGVFPRENLSTAENSPFAMEQTIAVLELYARLKGVAVPVDHFAQPAAHAALLRPILAVDAADVPLYADLIARTKKLFRASTNIDRALTSLEADLPEKQRPLFREELKRISSNGDGKFNKKLLNAIDHSPGSLRQLIQIMEAYAQLKGRAIPDTHFQKTADVDLLFESFYSIRKDTLPLYVPLLETLQKHFQASKPVENMLTPMELSLPADKRAEFLAGLRELSPKKDGVFTSELLQSAVSAPGKAEEVVRIVELYARLAGEAPSKTHFRDKIDFDRLLARFPKVTETNLADYEPFRAAVAKRFGAEKFSKVMEALVAALPENDRAEFRKNAVRYSFKEGAFSEYLLRTAQTGPRSMQQVIEVFELYARTKGLAVPATHYKDAADFEAVLASVP